jgi:hypothetical protein
MSAAAADTTAGDWMGLIEFSVMVDPFSAATYSTFATSIRYWFGDGRVVHLGDFMEK